MSKQWMEAFEARIYTDTYRIYGMIHLAPAGRVGRAQATADLLNLEARPTLAVSGARLYAPGYAHPPEAREALGTVTSIAVPKEQILWVVGGRPATPSAQGLVKARRLALIFPGFFLVGKLFGPGDLRFPEWLAVTKPFQTLFEAELYLLGMEHPLSAPKPVDTFEFVTVNLRRVQGFTDVPQQQEAALTVFG
ncbi:hypothetical protein Marky_2121 [Marinithermus hydrothermalis DSM 14884]|uniref:Uncharacterized protein n=2 Tax=Marinithermus TaxID=186191 RepID=F2NPR9_MARHT|nr:hypothetical protein Marky_2121 [Marinithermus hydrothermalis DSM 14884]